jgi:hypothetical protein
MVVDMVNAPWLRAEVLRVLHKYMGGVPTITPDEARAIAQRAVSKRDLRFMQHVTTDDLDLLNACLDAERDAREHGFDALERLLALCQFEDGALDERVLALPHRAFARAALDLYALGWIDRSQEDN